MSEIGRRISKLSPERRAQLEKMLLEHALSRATAGDAIPRRSGSGPWPLSFTQQRLWFLAQLEPESTAYNEVLSLRIRGEIDLKALRKALAEVEHRHEALRTVFTVSDGRPAQVVLPPREEPLEVEDFSGMSAEGREEAAMLRAARVLAAPVDLTAGPVFRPVLLRLSVAESILVFLVHHIAYDGWSQGVLQREVTQLYNAFAAGEPSPLQPLAVQYADFAVWQQQWLSEEALKRQFGYWHGKLVGAPVLELPSDRPRPPVQTHRGGTVHTSLPKSVASALESVARQEGATLFMALMASLKTLLARYSGQDDIVVGTPIANRTRVELEPLIGFFANTLALRTDLSGDPSFRELLRRERETALHAYENQDMPFEKLVEKLHPERNAAVPPLCQVALAMQNSPSSMLSLGHTQVQEVRVARGTAKFDLTLSVEPAADGYGCCLTYNSSLFDRSRIERMAAHFLRIVESATSAPDESLSRLHILTDEERSRLISRHNATARDYPRDRRVDEVFDDVAARYADSVACVCDKRHLTYLQLASRANRLANRLRALGVGPETLVGLSMERSLDMVTAMLAILKAGGAYVPLDPQYPRERLDFMIRDSGVRVILSQERLLRNLPATTAAILCLDADAAAIDRESDTAPETSAGAESPAYVIYTSGSTGAPKGVVIPHRGITRLVINTDYCPLAPSDVLAQVANASFDAATWEIWGALLNGARTVIITTDILLSPREFADEIARAGVTAMFLTTSLFNHFARELPESFASLGCLMVGGEALDPPCVRRVLSARPPRRLLNAYGPTESTTFATWHEIVSVQPDAVGIPIGLPIANTTAYVLDKSYQPVPLGVPGELMLGGDGLAVGYHNRPELTSERFVDTAFGRLYRTGDLARRLEDGAIDFLGRIDRQVKLRGFRIELAEIEAALGSCDSVSEAVVLCREDAPGDKRLVAYVVSGRSAFDAARLREHLRRLLPDYMVPAVFVPLERLPVTPNGKIDHAALPRPEATADASARVPARTPVEAVLAQIWSEVIGVADVGVRDNFFDLGGHSLMAVRLFARIDAAFGTRVPLTALFAAPTIEKLAAVVAPGRASKVFPPLVEIEKGVEGRMPLFCIATADAFIYASLGRRLGPQQPLYGLHPQGIVPVERARFDVGWLAARYIDEIRKVRPRGPYCLAGICAAGVVAWEMARQLRRDGEEVALLAMLDTYGPWGVGHKARIWYRSAAAVARHAADHARLLLKGHGGGRIGYLRTLVARLGARLRGRPVPPRQAPAQRPVEETYWMVYNGAYIRALARYRAEPYDGNVALFYATDTSDTQSAPSRDLWRALALGGSQVYMLPGKHMEVLYEQQAELIAQALRPRLGAAAVLSAPEAPQLKAVAV